ncbi:MAG TPA: serpin family protein, partial [Candidatus Baltobacteraceae bacterium]
MKRIAVCLTLAICAGATPKPAPVNYNAFGISALQRLSAQSKNENVFISPLSIGVALAMSADGARGATRDAIIKTLGLSGAKVDDITSALVTETTQNQDAQVGIANALWTREDVKPRAQYVEELRRNYDAQVQALNFGNPSAADAINAWTKAHTLGLIGKIVDRTTKSDFIYLTNALAFKGTWTLQFKKQDTAPKPFTNADGGKSTVPMMSQNGEFGLYKGNGFSALRMLYGKGGYAAYVLLPEGGSTDALVKKLSDSGLDAIARNARETYMHVEIPRFSAQYATSLVPLLKAMGMGIAFTKSADFSGIHAIPPPLAVTSVNHASYVR